MSTRFTELIELNQIEINSRIDDVVNMIASGIECVLTKPYPCNIDYDSGIIAIIEDIDLELRLAKVSVFNIDDGEQYIYFTDLEEEIRKNARNLYNEKLSYERWENFVNKLSAYGKVVLIRDYAAHKNILENYKFAIILNPDE